MSLGVVVWTLKVSFVKSSDLVKFVWNKSRAHLRKDAGMLGLILEESRHSRLENGTKIGYWEVWWMEEDRVSPIDPQYLEVISESR
jgi:hypothetical protein